MRKVLKYGFIAAFAVFFVAFLYFVFSSVDPVTTESSELDETEYVENDTIAIPEDSVMNVMEVKE